MAYLSDYTAGTVTVSGTTVTGSGTAWQTAQFREGDWFIADGWVGIVASVESNTSATLVAWAGPSLSGAPYRMRYMSDGSRASAQARQLIDLLGGSGSLEALAALDGLPDTVPMFTGPGQMTLVPRGEFGIDATDFWRDRLSADEDAVAARVGLGLDDAANIPNLPASKITSGVFDNARISATLTPDKAFRRGNILGTVSQSAGVPTGAIIERGSNTNGEYIRFADGTQVCTIREAINLAVTATVGSSFRDNSIPAWTFPSSFVTADGLVGGFNVGSTFIWGTGIPANNTSISRAAIGAVVFSGVASCSSWAIGRWF